MAEPLSVISMEVAIRGNAHDDGVNFSKQNLFSYYSSGSANTLLTCEPRAPEMKCQSERLRLALETSESSSL